jgi:hypothetical protein
MESVAVGRQEQVLERAWSAPGNTAVSLPPVDVNQVLADHYDLDRELIFTRSMLWDMEVRKASAPDVYIPTVVKPGSVEKFGEGDDFVRVSDQLLWLDQSRYGTVVEDVHLDHERQSAFFVGVEEFLTPDGRTLRAGTGQPLFHVEHSVSGTEDRPLNLWRIVSLTGAPDRELEAFFAGMAEDKYLRVFVEVYIREVLGRTLTRR